MGSTDKEDAGIGDCGVGSIVWVRRRNGSWWPGKILGAAELSAANLVSPRSGTPVKLLGREDASVDWYNLEKSKRVKPFRCGEFDQCIERAESALGMPPKKREKYARREDAILHALELEKQLVDDKPGNLDSPVDGCSSKYSAAARKEKVISSECSSYENKKNSNLKPNSKKPVVATEDEDMDDHIHQQEANEASQMGGDVDTSELLPRIRVSLEQKRKLADDDVLTLKSLVKRRDRRRNLVQVLQKSEKLSSLYLPNESNDCSDEDEQGSPIPMAISPSHLEVDDFSRPTGLDEDSASESTESTETDSSKTLSMDSDKDDGIASLAEPALVPESEPTSLEISGLAPHGSLSGELPTGNDFSHLRHHDLVPTSFGISKWQIKGKRNNRSLSRRSTEATDRWVARGSMYTADLKEAEADGLEESEMIERKFNTQRPPYYNQKYTSNPKASFKGYDDVSRKMIDWDSLAWNEQPLMRGYRDDTRNYRTKSGFVDVDLKVQSSYQREHVPLISLRSKLNGKAIVGHPIQVEILESGSTDSLLSSANAIGIEISDNGTVVPPVWRTARRSANFRVPRSQQSMTSVSKKGPNKKAFKQPPKKMISPSNQKVRNLSAIGGREQIFGIGSRNGNNNSFGGGGLIKGEAGPTTVACIPVKLVFCRLNEGLVGRHQ